jgi:hypothetical protein
MAEAPTAGEVGCAFCSTPIVCTTTLVEVDGSYYCCPNCELAARQPATARRVRRGGGLVLTCAHCGTPIIFSEIMVSTVGRTYCCANCAEVAGRRAAAATAAAR